MFQPIAAGSEVLIDWGMRRPFGRAEAVVANQDEAPGPQPRKQLVETSESTVAMNHRTLVQYHRRDPVDIGYGARIDRAVLAASGHHVVEVDQRLALMASPRATAASAGNNK